VQVGQNANFEVRFRCADMQICRCADEKEFRVKVNKRRSFLDDIIALRIARKI